MFVARQTRALVAAVALSASLLVAGCGGSAPASKDSSSAGSSAASSSAAPEQPSMGDLYTKVRAASLAAKSGHLKGTVTDGGQKMTLEIEGTADGKNQLAKIGLGEGTAQVLTVGSSYFLSGDKAFWTEQMGDASTAKALVGKHIQITASDAKEIGDLSLGSLLKEMFEANELSALEKLTSSVETRTEAGKQVWVASDGSGSEIWVDPTSERLVKLVVGGDDSGELVFDSWDEAQTFTKPAASKIVKP